MRLNFILGSTSTIKRDAVLQACTISGLNAFVDYAPVFSSVPEQPIGMEQTLCGAIHRAFNARVLFPQDICVGIENGLVLEENGDYSDFAYVAFLLPSMEVFCAASEFVAFPREDVETALERGVTAGSVIAERAGCDPTDPHSYLTDGKMNRKAQLLPPLLKLLKKVMRESL